MKKRTDIENLIINYPLIVLKLIANGEKEPYGSIVDYDIESIQTAIERYNEPEYVEKRSIIEKEACFKMYTLNVSLGDFSSFRTEKEFVYALERGLINEGIVLFDINTSNIK